jgi:hypothetical protein
MASGHVTCSGCDFEGYLQYRPVTLIYRLDDGTEVESFRTKGWCQQCENISDIEGKVDQEPLRAKLAELQLKARSMSSLIGNAFGKLVGRTDNVKNDIANIQRQLQLAHTQDERARCLKCGSENTIPIAFNHQGVWTGFVHDCGGQFKLEPTDPEAPRFSYRPETIYLDQDGFRT